MRAVYVNARFLTQSMTGVQRVASEISKQLKILLPNVKFICPRNIKQTSLAEILQVEVVGKSSGHLWEQTELPLFLKRKGSPLLINLGNTGPVLYSNSIVTIHDLAFMMFPEAYNWKFYHFYKNLVPVIVKNSRKVITVSEGAREIIMKLLKVPKEKIEVVYNAASHITLELDGAQPVNVPYKDYILAVASFNPIKNLQALVNAFEKIENKEIKLVVVGARQKSFNNQQFESTMLNSSKIIFTGQIDNKDELIALYKNARAFIFPSLYESFGIPALEAMLNGCPVICSRAGSLYEICGESALYIDPYDIESITSAIDTILSNESLRMELINQGFKRASGFRWEDSGLKLARIIEKLS